MATLSNSFGKSKNKIKFEIGKNKDSEIIEAIINTITKYYPITDNRIESLLGPKSSVSKMTIDFTFVKVKDKDMTGISFDWSNNATSLPDFLEIDGLRTESLLYDLFTTVLKDHEVINIFSPGNSTLEIETAINFRY